MAGMGTARFRMFIDESGSHTTKRLDDPANRYLCLIGLIFGDLEEHDLIESLRRFKIKHFGNAEVVLHRDDIVKRRGQFEVLKDRAKSQCFDSELLALAENVKYSAVSVTIDKLEHVQRYKVWNKEPYHYCLEVLLERFVMHLDHNNGCGDIMIEARDKKLDAKLRRPYQYLYTQGTSDGLALRMPAKRIQARMTSREIKIRSKTANIAGLQLADIFANPACAAARTIRERRPIPASFGGKLVEILEVLKYRRSADGKIEGFGRKWLP
jgi:hypothetical protein